MSTDIAAIRAAVPSGATPVEVTGTGAFADSIRSALASDGTGRPPAVIIDTTGDPATIVAALRRLDDLGTLVLAGPAPAEPVDMDLYADLHVRGLTVVGIGPRPRD